jgi:hypothetical protein
MHQHGLNVHTITAVFILYLMMLFYLCFVLGVADVAILHLPFALQLSYGLQWVGLNNATSATGAALIGGIVLWNTISAFAPWSATFSEENLRVGVTGC